MSFDNLKFLYNRPENKQNIGTGSLQEISVYLYMKDNTIKSVLDNIKISDIKIFNIVNQITNKSINIAAKDVKSSSIRGNILRVNRWKIELKG